MRKFINKKISLSLIAFSIFFNAIASDQGNASFEEDSESQPLLHLLPKDVELLIIGKLTNLEDLKALRLASTREYKLIMEHHKYRTRFFPLITPLNFADFELYKQTIARTKPSFKRSKSEGVNRRSILETLKLKPRNREADRAQPRGFLSLRKTNGALTPRVPVRRKNAAVDLPVLHVLPYLLTQLGVREIKVSKKFISSLCSLRNLQSLRVTNVQNISELFPKITRLPALKSLTIEDTDLTDKQLVQLKEAHNLKELFLSCNRLDLKAIKALSELENLRTLHIKQSDLRTDLSDLSQLTDLAELALSGCNLSDKELKFLQALKHLQNVRLENNTEITLSGLERLSMSVKMLDLVNTGITSENIPDLAQHFEQLKKLQLGGLSLNTRHLRRATQIRPGLEFTLELCTMK